MHYQQAPKTGLIESSDFLDLIDSDQCHVEHVLKKAAYPEIVDAQVVEKSASDVVHATEEETKAC